MSFVFVLALGIGLLVVAPYVAHRLRRKRAEERPFAPAHLVPPAPPRARRRAKLEDHALFLARALAVIALAVLGASPLVRCSRLALARSSGASVAIAVVIDDSMSMRAKSEGTTRFVRAKEGARQLLASTRDGDAVAIVLAGAPARVALAATTDLTAARAAVDALTESDRATDLDGALSIARTLVAQLPQVDRRVVVLSDLADGHPEAPPLGEGSELPVWVAMPELRDEVTDCGILSADRQGLRVRVQVTCSHGTSGAGREVVVFDGEKVVAHAPGPGSQTGEVSLALLPETAKRDESTPLVARLSESTPAIVRTTGDAIAADDTAPVMLEAGPGAVAVVVDTADEAVATGGAPVVEQALAALSLDIAVRPIPAVPDRSEDLAPFVGAIIDDPPGLTPEQRRAIWTFVEQGGAVLIALGPRAASAPLGASLEPILTHAVSWEDTSSPGADVKSATGALAESAGSLADLAAKKRIVLASEDRGPLDVMLTWSDGAPMFARRAVGRGEAWVTTLPFAPDASDLPLRPAFLALLDAWVATARAGTAPRRTEVGAAWTFPGARRVEIQGPAGKVEVLRDRSLARAFPPLAGLYAVTVDGRKELRVAAPVAREIDLRPRAAAKSAGGGGLGDNHASIDASPAVALFLLMLVAVEMVLRLRAGVRGTSA